MSDYLIPAAAIFFPNIGGLVGGYIKRRNVTGWYEGLKLPSWRPPNRAFPIVWTTLYCTMGYASYLVWRDGGGFTSDAALPLAAYGAQLALNWAWNPIFFGAHSLKWALVDILCLWGGIAGTIYLFYGVSETAAYAMLPYLGWVSFATALTFKIWKDNPKKKE